MAFSSWSTTNSGNATVGGINIAEGCPAGNTNNAIREVMAELRVAIDPFTAPLLAATNGAEARNAIAALSTGGGPITGDVYRSGAGALPYWANVFPTSRLFLSAASGGDPSGVAGDIWFNY
tara:strand:- start:16454 stop:16816 length:363 start_codon:yes stop_codon:yes gene_type:complete